MPATPVRDIELIEVGSLGKETLSNDAFLNLSHGISGAATIPLDATDHTLTTTTDGEAMRFVLILVGALTANVNVIVPAESRVYVVDNRTTGAFTVTFRPAAGGGVAVDQSARTLIYCDGSNVYPVASGTGGGGGAGAPTDASYLVGASHTLLSGERVVTNTPTISWDLATAGQARAIIPPDAVSYTHIQNVAPTRLLGRFTAGSGDVQEITPGTGLTLDASGVLSVAAGGGAQPLDATLTALAGVTTAADTLEYFTGVDVAASTPLTPLARTLLDDTTQAAMQATLALVPGTTVQVHDATTTALAGVTTGADKLPFFTGVDTASTTTLTAFMRSLLDDPDAATARTTLGVTGGSTTLLGLTDVPDTYTGQASKVLAVKTDETGTEFVTPAGGGGGDGHWERYSQAAGGEFVWIIIPTVESDMLRLGTSTATPDTSAPGTMRWSGTDMECWKADAWVSMTASGGGGSSTLLGLSDVPDSYAGQAGKYLAVNATESAVEFVEMDVDIVDGLWLWTSATTGAVSEGYMGVSNGTPISTVEIRIHELPSQGSSMVHALHRLKAGDLLAIRDASTDALMIRYILTGIGTDQGAGNWTLPITYQTGSGSGFMVNNQQYAVRFSYESSGSYTDEQAQDAVGAMLAATATIALAYADATPALTASVIDGSITEAKLGFSDLTTKDASTTAHGLLRKLSGTATQYLDGSGAWTTPAGGTNYWSRVDAGASTLATGCLAFWNLEEATGNRADSVGTNPLVPTGTAVQVTNAAGKIGNALAMNGTAGTYLSVADNATFSAAPNMSFTLACWVWINATGTNMGLVGKGSAAVSSNNIEYILWHYSNAWRFEVGSGSSFVSVASPTTPVANQWCLLIGWYDHVADLQYISVNNGTPTSIANAVGSYDSTLPFEVGRTVGFASQSLNGRLDMVGFWKRVLTTQERTEYWNNGQGLTPPFTLPSRLSPATISDQLLLAASATTNERLEVDGALKLGTAVGTTDGTLRWSGTDMEARKAGAWVSMTAGAGGQPLDATLTALAGLATAADRVPYFTGVDTAALATFTAAGRTLAGAADAAAQRGALALGTMAQQDAASVAITGGGANLTQLTFGGANIGGLQTLYLDKNSLNGILIRHIVTDTGPGTTPLVFQNMAGSIVGSIGTNATTTTFNTSSDARLKHAITALTGALDAVTALRPVHFLWNANDEPGEGFLAHELMRHVPAAVTGEPDAVNEDGSVRPQGVDHSRLVPWLTAALQETLAQVQALTARVTALEAAMP